MKNRDQMEQLRLVIRFYRKFIELEDKFDGIDKENYSEVVEMFVDKIFPELKRIMLKDNHFFKKRYFNMIDLLDGQRFRFEEGSYDITEFLFKFLYRTRVHSLLLSKEVCEEIESNNEDRKYVTISFSPEIYRYDYNNWITFVRILRDRFSEFLNEQGFLKKSRKVK